MTVPHRVQNLSLGSISFPHDEHVQPVRRKRAIRELIRSTPEGAGPPHAGAGGGTGGGGADEGDEDAAGGGGDAAGGGWETGAAARPASYRALFSSPESRSRLIARTVSRSCCDRSGAVTASAAACRLSRSTACSICSVGASAGNFRYPYQSDCCCISSNGIASPLTCANRQALSRPSGRPRRRRCPSGTRGRSWWTPARRWRRPRRRPAGSRSCSATLSR